MAMPRRELTITERDEPGYCRHYVEFFAQEHGDFHVTISGIVDVAALAAALGVEPRDVRVHSRFVGMSL